MAAVEAMEELEVASHADRYPDELSGGAGGALAFLGALLGIAGAYVALAATYHDDLGDLSRIPVLSLALLGIGVPLVAGAAGWLLAGREPPTVARPVLE
jgi:putative ABC transport system permease protein